MANNNYNLKGFFVKIRNYTGSTTPPTQEFHNYYFLFADLVPPATGGYQSIFSQIQWSLQPVVSGETTTYQIQGVVPSNFPAMPTSSASIRTYLIGQWRIENSAMAPAQDGTGIVQLFNQQQQSIAIGNPCARRPPVVKWADDQPALLQGYGYGLQCLRGQPLPQDNINTIQPIPDYFCVVMGKVPPPYNSTFTFTTELVPPTPPTVGADTVVLIGTPGNQRKKPDTTNRMPVGVFDCCLNADGSKSNTPILQCPTLFTVSTPQGNSPEPIAIVYQDFIPGSGGA
jgi:hypothetical protein